MLPQGQGMIALHEPVFKGAEREKLLDCIDTGWVSYAGSYVQEFDKVLAARSGVKHAICLANGTISLHIALKLVGVKEGDEVLVPALTFVATANAVSHMGAVPHFIDSAEDTLGVDPAKLKEHLKKIAVVKNSDCVNKETGRRISAIVPVHIFGHPCDMDAIAAVAEDYNLKIVEDAAESLGSLYKGKPAGSLGHIAALSFNGNKIVTTGGGGAILTDDDELAARARHITTTARVKNGWRFTHDEVGYNFRLPNVNAAIGCAQMEKLDEFVTAKRKLAEKYKQRFSGMKGLRFFTEPSFAKSNYWLNALLLDEDKASALEPLLELTNNSGIMTRPAWDLMNSLPMYKNCPSMKLDTAESLARRVINIPSSAFLAD